MKKCVTVSLFVITMLLCAGAAQAKTFYLSDGATIDYKKVWKKGERIYLLVNRDTLLVFTPDEVNQRKTLKAAGLKKFPRMVMKKRKAAHAHAPRPQSAAKSSPDGESAAANEKPLAFGDSLEKVPHMADSRSAPQRGRTSAQRNEGNGAQGLSAELLAAYERLHNAMKSRNVEQVKQHLSARRASTIGEQEETIIKAGVSMMPPNRTVTESSTSADGTTATLMMTARVDGSSGPGSGTITFVREDGEWKVDQESWEFQMN